MNLDKSKENLKKPYNPPQHPILHQMVWFLPEYREKQFYFFDQENFRKNQTLNFEQLSSPLCSKFYADSKYNKIYVYLGTKTA